MKKLTIAMLSLLMAIGSLVSANTFNLPQNQQSSKTPEERAAAHNKRLTEKLGLNADQQKNVYDYCLQRAQQEDADRAKYQGDKNAMRSAHKQNEQNFENNLYTVLTPDQKTKYEQMKQEQKAKRQNRGGHSSSQE